MAVEIHTLKFGNEPWLKECAPTLKKWSKKHRYELCEWDNDPKLPTPKLVIHKMLEYFLKGDSDTFAYVDADIWFHPEAPKLQTPEDGILVTSDSHHRVHNEHFQEWVKENYKVRPNPEWNYCNAGMWVISRPAAAKLALTMRQTKFVEQFQEQHWFNLAVMRSKIPVGELDPRWNRYGKCHEPSWAFHLWGDTKMDDLRELKRQGLTVSEMERTVIQMQIATNSKALVLEFIQDGGLGNQMFEWATGYSISKELGLPFHWKWKPSRLREYELVEFGIDENPPEEYEVVMKKLGQGSRRLREVARKRVADSPLLRPAISCPFQDEQCFIDHADDIAEQFTTAPVNMGVPEGTTPIGVQVRRGDYLSHSRLNVTTPEYFTNAMRWMRERFPNAHFVVVSDDPEWCRRFFGYREDTTVMPRQSSYEGIATLASCHGHIISNSTFGWWGAWLGERRHGGPVIVPELWHHGGKSYGDWNPVPARWNRIGLGSPKSASEPQEVLIESVLPNHERAVVYPYHADAERWHELRYSLRSIHQFFEDTDCPIYILGTRKPGWLIESHRVKYLGAYTYREALSKGVQLAKEVLWMNDDIVLLHPTTWADCRKTLYMKDVGPEFLENANTQGNPWREGCLKMLRALAGEGIREQRVYSTHTPYVYKREEAMEILKKYGVWEKFPMELAYFHHHAVDPTRVTTERAMGLPFGTARFLNYSDRTLTEELKRAIMTLLPERPPWEMVVNYGI